MTALEEARRRGFEQGFQQGLKQTRYEVILSALQVRFGTVPAPLEQAVQVLCDPEVLSELLIKAIKVPSLEAFEALLREWPDG